jgi:hypothetical protein
VFIKAVNALCRSVFSNIWIRGNIMQRHEIESLAGRLTDRARSRVVGADSVAAAADLRLSARIIRGLAREPGGPTLVARILTAPDETLSPAGIEGSARHA